MYNYLLKKKKHTCIYLNIYSTRNLKDFTNALANVIYGTFPVNKGIGKLFWEAIKVLRPVLNIDPVTGNPELSLDITQPRQFEKTLPQLLVFLDGQNKKVVIAFDEEQKVYGDFIKGLLKKNKFNISDNALDLIMEITDCHTYYTQRLCHELIIFNQKNIQNEKAFCQPIHQ